MAELVNLPAPIAATNKPGWPPINVLAPADILDCLDQGIRDFRAAPKYGLFFGAFYAIAGWLIVGLVYWVDMAYLAYPLATGFALFAPFAATGLYDISRRLERREPLSWSVVLGSVYAVPGKELAWMAVVTVFTVVIWLDIAAFLFFGFMGMGGGGTGNMLHEILTTPRGWAFLAIGNAVGAILAALVFSYSVVSFPMLFDRNVDFVTAMVSSVKTVLINPWPMFLWAAIIAVQLALSLASGFIGLVVALPVLGHTTWHIYRKAVGPSRGAEGGAQAS